MAPQVANSLASAANSSASSPSSSSSSSSSSSASNCKDSKSSVAVQKYLTNCKSYYSCIYCRTHLADHDHLVSRSFQGNHGRAYLFDQVVNISCGPAVQRELNTGSHAVADIFCTSCERTLGWKYEKAYVETQKYKEGKFIIELAHVVRENRHLELDKGEMYLASSSSSSKNRSSARSFHRQPSASNANSLSPSSPNCLSSSDDQEGEDEEDEELLFPFYDDLRIDRSSYSSNFSSSNQNRLRRSVYLDSAPYDWKYYTTSPSSSSSSGATTSDDRRQQNNNNNNKNNKLASIASPANQHHQTTSRPLSLNLCPPSTSSSASGSPGVDCSKNIISEDTQFKFEADGPGEGQEKQQHQQAKSCDQNNSGNAKDYYFNDEEDSGEREDVFADMSDSSADINAQSSGNEATTNNSSGDIYESRLEAKLAASRAPRPSKSSAAGGAAERLDVADSVNQGDGIHQINGNQNKANQKATATSGEEVNSNWSRSSSSNSISLDDEEFYDCCTDHEISNASLVLPPPPTSNNSNNYCNSLSNNNPKLGTRK